MCHLVTRPHSCDIIVFITIAVDLQYVAPAAFGWYNINLFTHLICTFGDP